jgi:hypothetical protein
LPLTNPLPLILVVCGAIALGLLQGSLNGMELAMAGLSYLGAAGTACSLFVVMSLLTGQVVSLQAVWMRVAVRVAGSWIAAAGLFMLGWAMRWVNSNKKRRNSLELRLN